MPLSRGARVSFGLWILKVKGPTLTFLTLAPRLSISVKKKHSERLKSHFTVQGLWQSSRPPTATRKVTCGCLLDSPMLPSMIMHYLLGMGRYTSMPISTSSDTPILPDSPMLPSMFNNHVLLVRDGLIHQYADVDLFRYTNIANTDTAVKPTQQPILKNVLICRYFRYRYWYCPSPTDF